MFAVWVWLYACVFFLIFFVVFCCCVSTQTLHHPPHTQACVECIIKNMSPCVWVLYIPHPPYYYIFLNELYPITSILFIQYTHLDSVSFSAPPPYPHPSTHHPSVHARTFYSPFNRSIHPSFAHSQQQHEHTLTLLDKYKQHTYRTGTPPHIFLKCYK